uniref:restriction endonuclease subunit S n=1 Tax=Thermomonas alba TaxID=2888525 RepID=UPI0034E2F2EA
GNPPESAGNGAYTGHWNGIRGKNLPWETEIEASGRVVQTFLKGQEDANRESKFLALLRDTLLPKLISGEMRVPDVDKFMGAMA